MDPSSAEKTNRKDSVLRAAAAMFAQHGIAETNLRQIARRADVSNGTLHYHFPSKDELIETLVVKAVEPMGGNAARIAEGAGDPFHRLQQIIELSFGLFDDDWDLYFVALLLGDSVRERIAGRFPTATWAMQKIIEQGQREGLMRGGDAKVFAIQCHGLIMRMARARVFGELEPPLRRFSTQVAESTRRILEAGDSLTSRGKI